MTTNCGRWASAARRSIRCICAKIEHRVSVGVQGNKMGPRRLSLGETLRMWDVQLSLDARMDSHDIDRLPQSMSPLIISSFLRNIWAGGGGTTFRGAGR